MERDKKQVIIFFIVNFGLMIITGLVFWFFLSGEEGSTLGIMMMLMPTIGVAAAKYLTEDKETLPLIFYACFIIFYIATFILTILCSLEIINPMIIEGWTMMGSLIFSLGILVADKSEIRRDNGLQFGKNLKKSVIWIVIYLALRFVPIIIFDNSPENIEFIMNIIVSSPFLLLSFFMQSILFMGEEYGWRYFLQGKLQKKFGLRWGVIILGMIWGLWHLPLEFMLYSPTTPLLSMVNRTLYTVFMSIFLGLVYMKTENIWAIAFIHFLNNGIASYAGGAISQVVDVNSVVSMIMYVGVLYLPFLFAKEYRIEKLKISEQ